MPESQCSDSCLTRTYLDTSDNICKICERTCLKCEQLESKYCLSS